MGLDDYLLNLPTIMASLKQKINDLRSKDFKGQYEAKKGVVKESKSEKQSILNVQNEDLSNESNFIEEGLNLDDLLTSSQQKICALTFFELESKEGDKVEEYDGEDDGEEGEERDEADDNGGEEDNEEFAEE
jgi:hypothetical protein